jgi:hypothetical protein
METAPPTGNHVAHGLTVQAIAEVVTQACPGNYALGYVDGNRFCVLYVGRSDADLPKELRKWIKEHRPRYKAFTFSYAPCAKAAFEKECEDFHDLGGTERLENVSHPQRTARTDWLCPRCNYYE